MLQNFEIKELPLGLRPKGDPAIMWEAAQAVAGGKRAPTTTAAAALAASEIYRTAVALNVEIESGKVSVAAITHQLREIQRAAQKLEKLLTDMDEATAAVLMRYHPGIDEPDVEKLTHRFHVREVMIDALDHDETHSKYGQLWRNDTPKERRQFKEAKGVVFVGGDGGKRKITAKDWFAAAPLYTLSKLRLMASISAKGWETVHSKSQPNKLAASTPRENFAVRCLDIFRFLSGWREPSSAETKTPDSFGHFLTAAWLYATGKSAPEAIERWIKDAIAEEGRQMDALLSIIDSHPDRVRDLILKNAELDIVFGPQNPYAQHPVRKALEPFLREIHGPTFTVGAADMDKAHRK